MTPTLRPPEILPARIYRSHRATFTALLALLFLTRVVGAQSAGESSLSLHPLRSNFEVGVPYIEPIATVSVSCSVKDLSATAQWGDGSATEILSHSVQEHSPLLATYDLFSSHLYSNPGTFKASILVTVVCSSNAPTQDRPIWLPPKSSTVKLDNKQSFDASVFDRVVVREFTSTVDSVSRGGTLKLSIVLAERAPPSGTRIFLVTDKPRGVFREKSFPDHIDVPAGSVQFSVEVPVLADAVTGALKIAAGAGGKSYGTISVGIH